MAGTSGGSKTGGSSFAPLREPTFRRIWTSSLFSNFGQLILGVGAAWEMTRLTNSPSMVALVQTALMLPLMLVAVPAGAVADMFDRRKIALVGLGFSAICGAVLTTLAFAGLTTPWILLAFCVLIGAGVALYSPSWQASIGEQVSNEDLPAAVALGTISYNVARSVGPAIGGLVVKVLGASAAFAINAVFYLPLWIAFWFWKRKHVPSRLPPERIDRAIVSGARYALHAPAIRTVLLRAFLMGLGTASIPALGPLVAKDLLGGTAGTYGLMLGAAGIGAVIGALFVSQLREGLGTERSVRLFSVASGAATTLVAVSGDLWLTCAAMFISGACNILTVAMLNVGVQLSAPRWVTARALSLYSSALTGGIAIGAAFWGAVAASQGLFLSLVASAVFGIFTIVIGFIAPLPRGDAEGQDSWALANEPEVAMELSLRSGPVAIEVEYDVDPADARDFYNAIRQVGKSRQRNGGFDWTIARDIANPNIWLERYHCPTWGDYLRMRDRYTQADSEAQMAANAFSRHAGESRVRRWLERPYGSVRWKADSPDPQMGTVNYVGP
ncbi:MFS transporter [Novosphingobium sp. TH158]|uniref:MFS transporter n=1 Tax=Novosphingobium sp. TH158 TaxID=2067455 RepID=UPI000C7E3F31|nr:MFS transporter [Novosphingobium sp. TH158]PLK26163.1 MFS transporter [Novosphingobium sp. TH158]